MAGKRVLQRVDVAGRLQRARSQWKAFSPLPSSGSRTRGWSAGWRSGWNCRRGSSRCGSSGRNLNLGRRRRREGRDNDIARETFERTGASVMGKRMFDLRRAGMARGGALPHPPCFVVTHQQARPLGNGRAGPRSTSSTTAIHNALARPREGRRRQGTSRIAGGSETIPGAPETPGPGRRVLDRALSPVLFGAGHPPVRRRERVQGRAGSRSVRSRSSAGDTPDLRRAPTVAAPPLHPRVEVFR